MIEPTATERFWASISVVLFVLLMVSYCSDTDASEYIPVAEPDSYHIEVEDALKTPLTAVQCLALNIYHEARSEPLNGQYAVAMTTLNRLRSRHYPDSICGVVLQSRQFSWTHDGVSDQPTDFKAWKLAYNLAYRFIEGGFVVPWMAGVTHYHRDDIKVWWPRLRVSFVIGRHVFYEPIKG